MRVSWTRLGDGDAVDPAARWDTLFDSQPCLAVGDQWPLGEEADRSGGPLARYRSGLLLTVGDHDGRLLLWNDDGQVAVLTMEQTGS